MNTDWTNFGDVSIDHGQTWIKHGGDDFAECVEISSGTDVCLADNQYLIRAGSIYFSPDNWDAALRIVGFETYGPPPYLEIAYAFNASQGMDEDPYGRGFNVVQVGKQLDDCNASGTACEDPTVILHGNASIERHLEKEYLI